MGDIVGQQAEVLASSTLSLGVSGTALNAPVEHAPQIGCDFENPIMADEAFEVACCRSAEPEQLDTCNWNHDREERDAWNCSGAYEIA